MEELKKLKGKLSGWRIEDVSMLALFEAAHQAGLLDRFANSEEQMLHMLEVAMLLYFLGTAAWRRHKAKQE